MTKLIEYTALFTLQAAEDSISFDVKSTEEQAISRFSIDFLRVFPNVLNIENMTINSLTNNSEEIQNNFKTFTAQYPNIPKLNAIEAFLRRLEIGESFYVIPSRLLSQAQTISIINYLNAQQEGIEYEEFNQQTNELFGKFLESYQISTFGDSRRTIGEKKRDEKQCRFCGKWYPDVSFEKKAHAISEALGNKTVVLTEECDDCNWRFSQTIEPDLVAYFAMYRTMYGIKGKGGEKEFKGKNFKFFKGENLELHFISEEDKKEKSQPGMPEVIKLDSGRKIRMQNIYRTLVKFVLSVIEKEEIPNFERTIEWINGEREINLLPKIAAFTFYDKLPEQPTITVHKRKDDNTEYPYMVGEFHFIFMKYIFIIPVSNKDNHTFREEDEYQKFWKKFKHLDLLSDRATFMDFSNDNEKNFIIKLSFEFNQKRDAQ